MTGSGKDSDDGWAGCLLLVTLGAIWGIISTWPWPLLILPIVFAISLATSSRFRTAFRHALRQSPVSIDEKVDHARLQSACFWLAAGYALLCALTLRWQSLQWWLIPIALAAAGTRLWALSRHSGRGARLIRVTAEHLSEFLTICAIVLALYTALLGWFCTWPIDAWTLEHLRRLDERVVYVHEAIERYKPHVGALLVIFIVIYSIGLLGRSRRRNIRSGSMIASWFAGGVRWSGRLATAAAIAASLTYLATEADGPLATISLSLRDAKRVYEEFNRELTAKVDTLLRDILLHQVWVERPPAVITEMHRSHAFFEARTQYEGAAAEANKRYDIHQDAIPGISESVPTESRLPPVEPTQTGDEDQWTSLGLKKAQLDLARWSPPNFRQELPKSDDPAEETAKEDFAEMLPADRLFSTVPVLEAAKLHYPVFGEVLDVVRHSISDTIFASIRNHIVAKVSSARRTNAASDFDSSSRTEAASALHFVLLDWRPYDGQWERTTNETLQIRVASLATASSQLQTLAAASQQARLTKADAALRTRVDELRNALHIQSAPDDTSAAAVVDAAAQLMPLAQQWPVLGEPSTIQVTQMREVLKKVQTSIPDFLSVIKRTSPPSRAQREYRSTHQADLMVAQWRKEEEERRDPSKLRDSDVSPYVALLELRLYCVERTTSLVGGMRERTPEAARLQELLGKRYAEYRTRWNKRVAEQEQERLEEQQYQAERAKEQREYEARRSYEVRAP